MKQYRYTGKNYHIVDKKAQFLQELAVGDGWFLARGEDGAVLVPGIIRGGEQVYGILFCDSLRNLTLVLRTPAVHIVTLIFVEEAAYEEAKALLKTLFQGKRFSAQNFKINSYARSIAEKLADGVELQIVDAVFAESVVVCPECGMQCEPGMAYCMDCGAELE